MIPDQIVDEVLDSVDIDFIYDFIDNMDNIEAIFELRDYLIEKCNKLKESVG